MDKYLILQPKARTKILDYMLSDCEINKIASYFQSFCDGTRLKIITCLAMCDMCVNDISILLKINQTTISHQLKLLKAQNIVSYRRDGKILVYHLIDKNVNDLMYFAVSNT